MASRTFWTLPWAEYLLAVVVVVTYAWVDMFTCNAMAGGRDTKS